MSLAYDKLILFGDSITEYCCDQAHGFAVGPALQNDYSRKLDVVIRGFSGYNSEHAVLIVDKIIKLESSKHSKIKLLIVFFGTNDCSTSPIWLHVPITLYQDNLRKIINAAHDSDIKTIIIGPGPYNYHQWRHHDTEEDALLRSTLLARDYCDAAGKIANETGAAFIPLWYLIMERLGWKTGDAEFGLKDGHSVNPLAAYLTDGIHFAGPAYQIEYEAILETIKKAYPELHPDNISSKLPDWTELHSCLEFTRLL
ncbi:SGNH hydrolase-type esterase domain-containing protein [Lipomyces japonicus]|uniref:SGNH hydrolase-type esterase domain-containing protein n=1 Tax=Lipomyces japonicus TaxID=56871 RepID=UPI0034CF8DA7